MPEFIVTGPDGKKYRVTGENAEGAKEAVKRRVGSPPPSEPSTASDMLRSIPAGLRRGGEFLLGMPGDVNAMTQSAAGRVSRALLGEQATKSITDTLRGAVGPMEGVQTPQVQAASEQLLGPTYEPKTRAGRYTRSVFEQVPGAVVGPGGRLAKLASALLGGVGGEAAGEAAEGTGYEGLARAGGSVVGALAGGRLRPGQTTRDAAHEANVGVLRREGVPMTAGQQTGSNTIKYIESELGGGAFERALDRQRSVFTEAAMRRLGESGGAALPEDLARARSRIGGEFDRLSASTAVPFDPQLETALTDIGARYEQVAPLQAPGVRQLFNSMIDKAHLNGGVLSGPQYQEMTTTLRNLGDSADPATQQALNGFRDALDDAVERTLGGPELQEWQRARRQYANLMTVERAMTGAGVEAASGQIAPTRLRTAITGGGQGPAAIAEGRSTMTDLANAGVGVVKDMPQSGTAPRLAARAIPAGLGAVGAGLAGGDPFTAGAAALGGFAAAPLMGSAVMSPFVQRMLMGVDPDQRALLAAILAGRTGQMGGQR